MVEQYVNTEPFEVDLFFSLAPSVVHEIQFGATITVEHRNPQDGEIALVVDQASTEVVLYRPNVDVLPFDTWGKSGRRLPLMSLAGYQVLGTVTGCARDAGPH